MELPNETSNNSVDILIAEDSPTQAEQLRHLLEERGFNVRAAANGRQALALAHERKPTLMVSDIVMPEMDGYALCREIKTHEDLKATPVILVTELSSPEDVIRGLECGADSFVRKPYEGRYLMSRIDYALANRRLGARAKMQLGVEITFSGRKHFVTSERQQILDLLISTFEEAVHMNEELRDKQEELRRSYQALKTLHRMAVSLIECTTEAQVLTIALERALELPGVQGGWISLCEGEAGFRLAAARGLPPALQTPGAMAGDCLCRRRLLAGELDRVTNILQCERLQKAPDETQGLRYHASVPLWIGEHVVGVMNLAGPHQGAFADSDLEILHGIGNQVAVALERAQLLENLEAKVEERTAALKVEFNERLRAEERVRQLAAIVESSQDAIVGKSLDGIIQNWNHGAEKLYQYTAEEAIGCSVSILVPPDAAAEIPRILARVGKGEETPPYETFRVRKDGVGIPVSVTVSPILDSHGVVVGASSIAHDISDRRRAEEAMRASETRFRRLFEAAKDGILILDASTGEIVDVNPFLTGLLGYPREAIMGKKLWELGIAKDVAASKLNLAELQNKEFVRYEDLPLETSDGRLIDVEFVSNVYWVNGTRVIQCNVRDITARVEAEKTLRETQEQLRQAVKMEAVGRLAGGVAHDFNNALTVISGFGQLLSERLAPGDPAYPNVEQILKAADRAASLTRQLLAFSRRQVLVPEVLNLNAVAADMAKMLRHMLGEDIDLVWNLNPDVGPVKVDRGQIEQVIMNMAVNARDAMPRGGKLTLETANVELDESYASAHLSVTPGAYVMLALSDTGVGMDKQTQAHIFEPFFTTKERGKGTGLGLAMVYGIVKQSGGSIWVYSEPGQGTTFKIYLPRVGEAVEPAGVVAPRRALARGSETVLMAEDDEAVRTLLRVTLQKGGYKVLEASAPGMALQLCREHQGAIQLLLTDMVMPEMNGRELAEQVKGLCPQVKVLYMSGYTDNAILRNGGLDPGTAFLQKPFTPDTLLRKIREVLEAASVEDA